MEQIKDIVGNVIEKLSSEKAIPNQQMWEAWQAAVGKKFIKHTSIESFKDGKLLVNIDSSPLLFHLSLKRRRLLERLQKTDGQLKILELRMGKVS